MAMKAKKAEQSISGSLAKKILVVLGLGFGLTMGMQSAWADTEVKPDNPSDNKVVVAAKDWYLDGGAQKSAGSPYSFIYGGYSESDVSSDNIVIMTGGTAEFLYGGYAFYNQTKHDSKNNVVVVGGSAAVDNANYGVIMGGFGTNSTGNLVQICTTGDINVSSIQGGTDSADGNTLIINSTGVTTGSVDNFTTYYFAIPDGTAADSTLLKNTAAITLTASNPITVNPTYGLQEGDEIILASYVTGTVGTPVISLAEGNSMTGTVEIDSSNQLVYTMGTITSWINVQPSSLTDNVVEVKGGTTATVNGVTQTLIEGTTGYSNWKNVYGGYSEVSGAYVVNNEVTISGGTSKNVYGGSSKNGVATGNSVTIDGGKITGYVRGGDSTNGNVESNDVVISRGTVSGIVMGGYSYGKDASGNSVVITGGTLSGSVYGGYSSKEDASNNNVVISGGTLSGDVFGGSSCKEARNNSVVVMDTPIFNGTDQSIYGGSASDTSKWNSVQLSTSRDANVNGLSKVSICGGTGATVSGNTLIVDGPADGVRVNTVSGFSTYAFYIRNGAGIGNALLNNTSSTEKIQLSTSDKIYVTPDYTLNGGTYTLIGGLNNSTIPSPTTASYDYAPGNVREDATLSYHTSGYLQCTIGEITKWTSVQPSSLTGNTVLLDGTTTGGMYNAIVNGGTQVCNNGMSQSSVCWTNVYGGYSTVHGAYVANNEVTISDPDCVKGSSTSVYGGYSEDGKVENNTLNIKVAGVSVKLVDKFDTYNFTLPGSTEDPMLSLDALGDDFQGDTITVTTNGNSNTVTLFSDYFASSLDNITFKVDGETVTGTDITDCFAAVETSDGSGTYKLTFQNNLGKSIIPTTKTSNNTVVVTGDRSGTIDGTDITDVPKLGKTWKDVYGGYSGDSGAVVQNNNLTIQAGTISGSVYAGYAPNGTATNNTLNWTGGTIKGSTIQGNEITITGTGAKYLGTSGTIKADGAVALNGTLTVGDTAAENISHLTFANGVNIGKNGKLVMAHDKGEVTLKGTSTLSGAIEGQEITNDGTLNITSPGGKLTLGCDVQGTSGTMVVKEGTELVYTGSGIKNTVTIEKGATMDPVADVFKNNVDNYGTLILEGGTLGKKIDNIGGTLKINAPVDLGTAGVISLDGNSTLSLAVAACVNEAAIQGIVSSPKYNLGFNATTKIQLSGDTDDDTFYKLFEADDDDTLSELQNAIKNMLIGDDGEFSEIESSLTGGVLSVKVSSLTNDELLIGRLAGVQQGMVSMQNLTNDAVMGHIGLVNKAKAEGKYAKEVWASYLNNKDSVDSLAGGFGSYDAKYSGVTVGVDFFSSEKSVAGVALTYANGDNDGMGEKSSIRNESKYYGIELYDRVDLKNNSALLMDLGYMNGKNETCVTRKSVTADAKVNSYTLGVRYEKEYTLGGSKLVPFAGVRYLRLQNQDYSNSRGLSYSTNSQNLFQPKIGVAWTGDYKMASAWSFKPKAEIGYLWALGNREADTALSYRGNSKGSIAYDVTDHSSYYAKLGIEFKKSKFAAGIDYSYMKGNEVRSNKWNVNVSWSF